MTDTVATTTRVMRLLGLLGSRPVWTGPELADHLGVTTRTVRRDVDRLRELGYPVRGDHGAGGGYQLGAGGRMPPLPLDDDEAVAVAVCLRLAAATSVSGVGEPAVRTLAKLDQVLPARLRERVAAIDAATVTLPSTAGFAGTSVDPGVLVVLAQAIRRPVRVRVGYVARDGAASEREVEPYRLVATGRRWYLLAYDLGRSDWRTLRLDRMAQVHATTFGFRPRPSPDAAQFVRDAVTTWARRGVTGTVRYDVDPSAVRARIPDAVGTVRPDCDGTGAVLEAGSENLDELAWHVVRVGLELGCAFAVLGPPELQERMRAIGRRVVAAADPGVGSPKAVATPDPVDRSPKALATQDAGVPPDGAVASGAGVSEG